MLSVAAIGAVTTALVLLVLIGRILRRRSTVTLHHATSGFAAARSLRLIEKTPSLHTYPASATVALLGGAGASVVLNGCRRRRPIRWTRSQDVRLPDGGMLRLQWLLHEVPAKASIPPCTLVLFPGTRGTAESPYITATARAAFARGWDVVVAPLRGCGIDGMLATPHCLDGVQWTDCIHVMRAVRGALPPAPDPRSRICAVGYSMGGGMLAHYVGETGAACPFTVAVAVSSTADYVAIGKHSMWAVE